MVGGAEKATLDVKTTIEQELIELVGAKFYQLDQLYRGKHPTEYDITEWVKMYRGREDLQPPFIELNTFRNEVNNFVSLLMSVISRHI